MATAKRKSIGKLIEQMGAGIRQFPMTAASNDQFAARVILLFGVID